MKLCAREVKKLNKKYLVTIIFFSHQGNFEDYLLLLQKFCFNSFSLYFTGI